MTWIVPYFDYHAFEQLNLIKKYEFFRTNKLFAEVYKVKLKENGKIYIANVSRPEEEDSEPKPLKMANLVYKFNHPSILKIFGYSKIKEENIARTVVYTEYYSKGILSDYIDAERSGKPIPGWNNTMKLISIYGIASGILYLHKRNCIHRDIKPSKILMDDLLFPKIRGFNLLISCEDPSREKEVKGTPEYMAPEILMRESSSKAMDVYSFSMIMYELITLKKPFGELNNPNVVQILQRVTRGNMPPFDDNTPESFKKLIQRCWAENPKDRPTFEEIVELLRTDPGFILEGVNKDEYLDYIDYLDDYSNPIQAQRRRSSLLTVCTSVEEVQILRNQLASKTSENLLLKEEIEKLKRSLEEEKAKLHSALEQLEKEKNS